METGKLVMIGDVLATSEEMLPGPGTYDDGANIRAARMGTFVVDPDEFAAVVDPATQTPVILKAGDIIIGEVYTVQESLVGIMALARLGDERKNISSDFNGTLHVAKVADRYIAVLDEVFKKGDLVRAKVVAGHPSLQLSTVGEEFGVIKARCSRCRHNLLRKGDYLECAECGSREVRYIAGDYGEGVLEPRKENMHGDMMQRGDRLKQADGSVGVLTRPPKQGSFGPPGRGRGGPRGGGGDRRGGGRGPPGRGGPRSGGGDRRGGDRDRRGGPGGRSRDDDRRGGRGGGGGGGRGRSGGRGGDRDRDRDGGGESRGGRGGGGGGGGRGGPRRGRGGDGGGRRRRSGGDRE